MNSSIPNDSDGKPIESEKRYVLEGKGIKPVKVEVSYDEVVGSLCARMVADKNVVVWKEEDNESNVLITWRRVVK